MLVKLIRLLSAALIGVVGVWWGRHVAHSKTPPPQGVWREIPEAELRRKGDNPAS